MFKYYTLSKCQEDKEFYFANNGLFNFWNEYIIFHKDNLHVVLVNYSNSEIDGTPLSAKHRQEVKNILNSDYVIQLCKHSKITYDAAQAIANNIVG